MTSMASDYRILLVDDEENLRKTMAMILRRAGYQVETAATLKEARQCLESSSFDLTFLDLKLPDANGLTLLPDMRKRFPGMPVVVLTAHDKLDSAVEAVRNGARDYLLKPLDPPAILNRVKQILEEKGQTKTAEGLRSQVASMLKEKRESKKRE